jgi:hypothetical protein
MRPPLTLGQVARTLEARYPGQEVPLWRLRELFRRGLLPRPARVGQYRVVDESDLDKIEVAMVAAGYLRPQEVPA